MSLLYSFKESIILRLVHRSPSSWQKQEIMMNRFWIPSLQNKRQCKRRRNFHELRSKFWIQNPHQVPHTVHSNISSIVRNIYSCCDLKKLICMSETIMFKPGTCNNQFLIALQAVVELLSQILSTETTMSQPLVWIIHWQENFCLQIWNLGMPRWLLYIQC